MATVAKAPAALGSLMSITTLYHEYDTAAAMLKNRLGVPICIRCGKCCENNTPFAYGVEAANAVSHLLGDGRIYKMQRRIEGWLLDKHRECPTYAPLTENRFSFGLDDKIRDEALALSKVKCPFFEEKGCLIYEFRPLACRAYGVTRAVASCPRPRGKLESESRSIFISGQAAADLKAETDFVLDRVPRDTWKHAGFMPALIYAHVWPNKFKEMVGNGLIATAKLVMTYPSMAVIFEKQVESLVTTDMLLY